MIRGQLIERDVFVSFIDKRTSSSLNKEALHSSSLSESSELKLPDASLLLNSPTMPGHLGHNTDHSSLVAAAMAENATRKRDIKVSAFTYPRSKIPKGTLPHMKNVPETGSGLLLPPQLTGRGCSKAWPVRPLPWASKI
ncbi:hypothetical protein KY284_001910 [Solanum tuberosum]|nr:hypothetical protein KY284_001910 [Solanum tuberosum]